MYLSIYYSHMSACMSVSYTLYEKEDLLNGKKEVQKKMLCCRILLRKVSGIFSFVKFDSCDPQHIQTSSLEFGILKFILFSYNLDLN
jgi:hypothetical protein